MKKTFCGRKPEIKEFYPVWWHHHGSKMHVEKYVKVHHLLIIGASAANLRITRKATTVDEGWYVDWGIVYGQQETANGRIIMKTEELRAAFGLSEKSGDFGDFLLQRYGGDSAEQGQYIRWGNFLNIPCPGTGHDGDPNISIEINDSMRQVIGQLLG